MKNDDFTQKEEFQRDKRSGTFAQRPIQCPESGLSITPHIRTGYNLFLSSLSGLGRKNNGCHAPIAWCKKKQKSHVLFAHSYSKTNYCLIGFEYKRSRIPVSIENLHSWSEWVSHVVHLLQLFSACSREFQIKSCETR